MDCQELILTACSMNRSTSVNRKLLGQWCVGTYLTELESIPYPLATVKSRYEAYCYSAKVWEEKLPVLAGLLNGIHSCNYSNQFWMNFVGYWFREYIGVLYERYLCLKEALGQQYWSIRTLDSRYYQTVFDTLDFSQLIVTDIYNHQLFSQILEHLPCGDRIPDFFIDQDSPFADGVRVPGTNGFKELIKWISLKASFRNRYFFASTYLPFNVLIPLSLRLSIFPTLDTPHFREPVTTVDNEKREVIARSGGSGEFDRILFRTLAQNIPRVYIECFEQLRVFVEEQFPKRKVGLILTGNAFAVNEAFKLWTAQQRENFKTPYAILQHGGNYGIGMWNASEEFEKTSSDYFVSYGWNDESKKIQPFRGARLRMFARYDRRRTASLLMLLNSCPRYTYSQFAVPQGPLFMTYLEELVAFLNQLDSDVRQKLLCKPYQYEYGWNDLDYLSRNVGELRLVKEKKGFWELARQSQLIISPFNTTTHLESLAANVPTLMFFSEDMWPIREDAKKLHESLKDVLVFHSNPASAAQFLNENHNRIDEWWTSSEVQEARSHFVDVYARASSCPIRDWIRFFKKFSTD